MRNKLRKWILRTFFRKELETLYWAFANIERQINRTHVHKKSKERIEKSISNFRRAFVSVQITKPITKTKRAERNR